MKNILRFIMLIVCMTCLSSCYDEDMFDPDTDNIEVKPSVLVPIGNIELTLGDLLTDNVGDDQSIIIENGVFVLKHLQKDIAEFKIKDLMEFPSETSPVDVRVPISGDIGSYHGMANDIPARIDLSFPPIVAEYTVDSGKDGVILKTLDCAFLFDIDLEALSFDYNIKIAFEGNDDMLIDQNVMHGDVLPLLDFTHSSIAFNTSDLDKRNKLLMTATITVLRGDYYIDFSTLSMGIPLNLSMKDFVFKKAEGDFGKMAVDFESDSFDFDMGDVGDLVGDFGFTDPEIKIILHNRNMGFKFKLDLDLVAVADDDTQESITNASSDEFIVDQIEKPIESGDSVISQFIVYNKSNSNIVALMDKFPFKRMEYSGSFSLNPDEGGTHYPDLPKGEFNFITSDASLNLDVEIKIPSKLKAIEGISYTHNIEDVDLGIDEDMKEKIISAGLIFKVKNGWPVGLYFKNIIFKDVNNIVLASMDGNILNVPVVDSDGLPIDGDTEYYTRSEIPNEVINILDEVKNIELLIQLEAGTAADGRVNPTLVFTNTAKLNLVMGIEAKLDLSQIN